MDIHEAMRLVNGAINSCEDAVAGTWEVSDDGFECLKGDLETVRDYLQSIDALVNGYL